MNSSSIYLICFVSGVAMSALSFLSATGRLHFHFKGHAHSSLFRHLPKTAAVPKGSALAKTTPFSPYNFAAAIAFVSWFGGAGALAEELTRLTELVILGVAAGSGMTGATIVNSVLKAILVRERELERIPMTGRLATVIGAIREGGTGEVAFAMSAGRSSCGARCASGVSLKKGTEVVITRFEKGIAYVEPIDIDQL